MDVLLDTHALLWFYGGDESLPVKLREQIKSFDNRCYLSVASLWEISIKLSLGKLELGTSLREFSISLIGIIFRLFRSNLNIY
ncbi:type II toxin-antitoxin system VapC family toxin [Siphonobacter curvatus]|uniref:type II toxin-antitoxin system VapC family toxin n=1 Tax=Siphonobacter curvatus TaxID=2094562 RepID=UPI00269BF668